MSSSTVKLTRSQKQLAKALGLKRRTWKQRAALWMLRASWRATVRVLRQGRVWWRALLPWYLACVVWVAAAVASVVDGGAVTLGVLAGLGAPVLYWWLGWPAGRLRKRRKRKPLDQRIWYSAAYVSISVWAIVAASWRLGPPMPGIWWGIAFTVWVKWVWHHRRRIEDVVDDILDPRQEAWLRVKGLKDTTLTGIDEFDKPKRWEADVDLSGTDLLVADVISAVPHIAKVFTQPRGNVIADYKGGRLEHQARLTVVEENPCDSPVVYDESWIPTTQDVADGCVPFHFYPNGMRGRVRLWLPRAGTTNTLLSGDIGSGKSAAMEAIGVQSMWTGRVWPMAADPQGGASMPALCGAEGVARWQAPCSEDNLDPIFQQLLFLREALHVRQDGLNTFQWRDKFGDDRVGLNSWDYDITGWPAIGFFLDEVWRLMQIPEFAALIKELLKMQRKVGFFMVMATQYPGIEEFNNDMGIRQCLTAGNILAYRNTAGSVKEMILPRGTPTPFEIPSETVDGEHTKGALVAVSQAPRSSLPAYSRSVWAERNVFWARQAAERVPELDAATERVRRKYMGAATPATIPVASPIEQAREVIEVAAIPVQPGKRLTVLDRVVAYLEGHPDRRAHTGVIAEALDMPKGTVSTTLGRAAGKTDRVHLVRQGIWGLGAAPQVQQQLALDDVGRAA